MRRPIVTNLIKENARIMIGMVGKHRNILFDLYGRELDFRYLNQGKWWRN
jgi:hypothetical protein